jgi:hypothetical protein
LSGLLCIAIAANVAAIRFDDFASVEGLSLVGDAMVADNVLRITRAKPNKAGAAWVREKQPVGSGFDTMFQFQLTQQGGLGHGADGFAFVLQNSGPKALGGRGSAGGFAVADRDYHHKDKAIPWSVAVFSIPIRMTTKEILLPTTCRSVLTANPLRCTGRRRA